jgi:hypothetical protein
MNKCCICGKRYIVYGNNAQPVKTGRCCDKCNEEKVLPARIKIINRLEKERRYK